MSYKNLDLKSDNSIYLKIPDGTTRIRILSEAIPVWTEFDRANKKATKYLDERLAHDHPDAKIRWAFWCVDRTDGKVKMAEVGNSVIKAIHVLANDPDYAFETIPPYDIKITRSGSGMETRYAVLTAPPTPLTAEEQAKVVALESVHDFFMRQPGVVTEVRPDAPPF